MKTIIAGSRGISDPAILEEAIKASGITITSVVSGMARGVDLIGLNWAKLQGLPVHEHYAQWGAHGKVAGFIRNKEMAATSEALIAIWDGKSKGTRHMIHTALAYKLRVYIHRI